ncbi:hypothetical protein SEA_SHAM_249 [Streptomyces phage Sham]|nr:hypothetical protein SEA_SHAM_249 [Streptomyces phage Sham]
MHNRPEKYRGKLAPPVFSTVFGAIVMDKTQRKKLKEWVGLILGGIGILVFMFAMMLTILSLDDSPNKCASKVASRVYAPECF